MKQIKHKIKYLIKLKKEIRYLKLCLILSNKNNKIKSQNKVKNKSNK